MYTIVTEVNGYKIRYEGATVEETVRLFREAWPPPASRGAYLRVREGSVAETREIDPGVVLADYGADGKLLGIECLAPCVFTAMR